MPAPKFTNHLDLDGHQLKNALIDRVDTLPPATAANAGRVVYLTTSNKFLFSTGLTWEEITSAVPARQVRLASTANVAIAALAPGVQIDGVAVALNDRVLLKDQAAPAENGVYVVNAAAPATRATDADSAAELPRGSIVAVSAGTANAGKSYANNATANYVFGVDPMPWIDAPTGGTAYTGGPGIEITGTVISRDRYVADVPVPGGGATSVTITHGLGYRKPPVEVWFKADNSRAEGVYVQDIDDNNVLLDFATAPTAGEYEVVIG